MVRNVLLFVAVAVGVGSTGASPGAGQEADAPVATIEGRAEGMFLDLEARVSGFGTPDTVLGGELGAPPSPRGGATAEFGPAPVVEVGPGTGGPVEDQQAGIVVPFPPFGDLAVGRAAVSTEGATGPGGFSRSSARLTGVDLSGLVADEIASSCEAAAGGVSGSASFTDAFIVTDAGPFDLPPDPAPNTVLTEADIPGMFPNVTITLNEQVVDPTGTRIDVTAIHVRYADTPDALIVGEGYLSRSVCGLTLGARPVPAEPTFTG